eukprot:8687812-Karenia_brevis.AAC.1
MARWATTSTGQRCDDESGGLHADLHPCCAAYPSTPPEQQTHVHHILNGIMHADVDVVTTCEDKDPAICWSMIGQCLMFRWCSMLVQKSQRWSFSTN